MSDKTGSGGSRRAAETGAAASAAVTAAVPSEVDDFEGAPPDVTPGRGTAPSGESAGDGRGTRST